MNNEVSSIANDSFLFYLDLNKKTRDAIANTQDSIQKKKNEVAAMEEQIQSQKTLLQEDERNLATLKQKELDIQGIISELEKNKAQFKNIVTGNKR